MIKNKIGQHIVLDAVFSSFLSSGDFIIHCYITNDPQCSSGEFHLSWTSICGQKLVQFLVTLTRISQKVVNKKLAQDLHVTYTK